jgi:hypothetical protein
MLYTIAVILLVLWLLGLVTSTTIGGFIHVLLVIADHRRPASGDQRTSPLSGKGQPKAAEATRQAP